jgi:hypothetical protein
MTMVSHRNRHPGSDALAPKDCVRSKGARVAPCQGGADRQASLGLKDSIPNEDIHEHEAD